MILSCLQTCPSDGKILHFGKSESGLIEQVKGIRYSMQDFLGPASWPREMEKASHTPSISHVTEMGGKLTLSQYENVIKKHADTCLYHCVIYLAPGDYHGFHSPTEWTITQRRHFPGKHYHQL